MLLVVNPTAGRRRRGLVDAVVRQIRDAGWTVDVVETEAAGDARVLCVDGAGHGADARKDLLAALETGQTRLNLRLKLTAAQHDALVADGSGDTLDAVLCMVQAAWGQLRREAGDIWYGLPPDLDPLEGWIVSV